MGGQAFGITNVVQLASNIFNGTGCLVHSYNVGVRPGFQDENLLIARFTQSVRQNKTRCSACTALLVLNSMELLDAP